MECLPVEVTVWPTIQRFRTASVKSIRSIPTGIARTSNHPVMTNFLRLIAIIWRPFKNRVILPISILSLKAREKDSNGRLLQCG